MWRGRCRRRNRRAHRSRLLHADAISEKRTVAGAQVKTTHVRFVLTPKPPRKRTNVWHVYSSGGDTLGMVAWYSRWRCYVFQPLPETIYSSDCLSDIAHFVWSRTQDHKWPPLP